MRLQNWLIWAVATLVGISTALAATTVLSSSSDKKPLKHAVPHEFIVQWAPGTSVSVMQRTIHRAGGKLRHFHPHQTDGLVFLPTDEAESILRQDPSVLAISPNMTMTIDSGPLSLWPYAKTCLDCEGGTPNDQQVIPRVVSRVGAQPGNTSYTGTGIGVAVLDTGIHYAHRDFVRTNGTQVLSPGCWKEDPFWVSCGDSAPLAGGHGTAVAGIIGAADNSVDAVGVAPGATIYSFNVNMYNPTVCYPYDSCINEDYVVHALDWIIAHQSLIPPIKVINMSFGRPTSPGESTTVLENRLATLAGLNVISVTAAGNDPTRQVFDMLPARSPNVLAVASTTAQEGLSLGASCSVFPHVVQDAASWYTTDGAYLPGSGIGVSVSAPGADQEDVVFVGTCSNSSGQSCLSDSDCPASPPGGVCGSPALCRPLHVGTTVLSTSGTTMRAAGTSIASPVVAGIVALMEERAISIGTTLTLGTVRAQLRASAILQGQVPYDSPYCGSVVCPGPDGYTFDGEREGVVFAPWALQQ